MIPQIDNSIDNTNLINEVILPSRTYRLSSNYETQIKYGDTQNVVGENIMLTDAAEVKVKKLDIKGNTKQDTTTGKNLFNAQIQAGTYGRATYSVARDGLITQSASDNSAWSTTQTRNFYLDAGTYTINCIGKGTEKRLQIRNLTDDVDIIQTQSEKETFTLTERKLLGMKTWGSSTYPARYYVQIEKGSEATTYEPYTGGIASPNPEYPQDIEVVRGNNIIKVSNKNLFYYSDTFTSDTNSGITVTKQTDGSYTFVGTATSTVINIWFNGDYNNWNNQLIENALFKIPAGTTITVTDIRVFILYDNLSKIQLEDITTTLTRDAYVMAFRAPAVEVGTTFNKICYPQLEISSTATTYVPHQGKELPLDLPVKNLCTTYNFANATILNDGQIYKGTDMFATDYIKVTVNTQYILHFKDNSNINFYGVAYYNADKTFISRNTKNGGNNLTFTTDSNTVYIRVFGQPQIGTIFTEESFNTYKIQLEQGSKANAYTPYGTEPIELCKIGNYQDYFYKSGSKWYLHKETNKKVLNGSENWQLANSGTSNYYYYYNLGHTTIQSSSIVSTHYLYAFISNSNTEQGILVLADGNIRIRYGTENTVANFKTWLATNNVSVYYPLATSTNTEITDTTLISQLEDLQQIKLYQNTTYINSDNEAGPILDIDYYPLSSIFYETVQVDRISGFIDDMEAIRQAVYHILSIERFSCLIYDNNYGVELQQYIGQDFEYLKVTIQKTLEEALMQDERIISIEVIDVEKIDNETANVKLSIQANVGEIQMEVNINV